MVDTYTIKLEGVVEAIVVSIDSWEYSAEFMILQPKANLGGHSLIIERPWLVTTNAYVNYRSRDMNISHRNYTKKLTLYPPAKPSSDSENPFGLKIVTKNLPDLP